MSLHQSQFARNLLAGLLPASARVVQRSIHDAHGEDCIDAAEGDAMPTIRDVMNAVEAQDVGSKGAQTRKDARITADAAGVLGEASVTDVLGAILDVPVVTDGFGTLSGWQHDVADEQGGLAAIAP
jgi:hypothetical protein